MATCPCDRDSSSPRVKKVVARRSLLAFTLVALQAADLVSTLLVIRRPGISELNPFLQGGSGYIVAAKILSAVVVVLLISRTKRLRLYWLLVVLFGFVVLNNLVLLW